MFTPSFPSVYTAPAKKRRTYSLPFLLCLLYYIYRYIQAYTVGQTRVLVYRVFKVKRLGQRKSSKKFWSVLFLSKKKKKKIKSFRILVRLGSF